MLWCQLHQLNRNHLLIKGEAAKLLGTHEEVEFDNATTKNWLSSSGGGRKIL